MAVSKRKTCINFSRKIKRKVDFSGETVVKICLSMQMWFIPGWGRSPQRRKWQPIPGFLPGKSHGQKRSPESYSLMGLQEVDPIIDNRHNYCSKF